MPPKRKSPAAASPRKTRSMAAGKRGAEAPAKTAKKEAEAAEHMGRKKAKEEDAAAVLEEEEEEEEETVPQPAVAKKKGRNKGTKGAAAAAAAAVEEDGGAVVQNGKRLVVEACTQCQQFKKRALKVKEDLESAVTGVSVAINPEKPRRGCLEIREEGGEVFISLLNMPRPFTAMKKLDMDEVIKDIVKKIS